MRVSCWASPGYAAMALIDRRFDFDHHSGPRSLPRLGQVLVALCPRRGLRLSANPGWSSHAHDQLEVLARTRSREKNRRLKSNCNSLRGATVLLGHALAAHMNQLTGLPDGLQDEIMARYRDRRLCAACGFHTARQLTSWLATENKTRLNSVAHF